MRRAGKLTVAVLTLLTGLWASGASAKGVDLINGVGLVDYAHAPHFQVGSWVRYHVIGKGSAGAADDYTLTIMVAGEERFWGEDCFWVETWMRPKNQPPRGIATLMSYDIFTDSLPIPRMEYYMRKNIDGINEDGTPNEQVLRRPASTLKKRKTANELVDWRADSLGADTVLVPTGHYDCQRIQYREGRGVTADQRDSTARTEVFETRVTFYSPKVPLTGLVKETMEYKTNRRAWAIGRSSEAAPFNVVSLATGEARLEAFGDGMKSQLVPEARAHSFKDQDADAARMRAPAATPARPASAKRKG